MRLVVLRCCQVCLIGSNEQGHYDDVLLDLGLLRGNGATTGVVFWMVKLLVSVLGGGARRSPTKRTEEALQTTVECCHAVKEDGTSTFARLDIGIAVRLHLNADGVANIRCRSNRSHQVFPSSWQVYTRQANIRTLRDDMRDICDSSQDVFGA